MQQLITIIVFILINQANQHQGQCLLQYLLKAQQWPILVPSLHSSPNDMPVPSVKKPFPHQRSRGCAKEFFPEIPDLIASIGIKSVSVSPIQSFMDMVVDGSRGRCGGSNIIKTRTDDHCPVSSFTRLKTSFAPFRRVAGWSFQCHF